MPIGPMLSLVMIAAIALVYGTWNTKSSGGELPWSVLGLIGLMVLTLVLSWIYVSQTDAVPSQERVSKREPRN